LYNVGLSRRDSCPGLQFGDPHAGQAAEGNGVGEVPAAPIADAVRVAARHMAGRIEPGDDLHVGVENVGLIVDP